MKIRILVLKYLYLTLLVMSLIVSCNCGKNKLDEISIRLKWLDQAQFAGFYCAKESGVFKSKNMNVVLRSGGVDYPSIQMVTSGSDQFGVTGADQILIARDKGIPVVAVACIYRKSPFVMFSLKESNINNIDDFVGKKIGVKLGGNEELTYRAIVKNAKIDSKRWTEIPVKFDISPLLAKEIDVWPGYSINEPITAEEKGFLVNLIWPEKYGIDMYADVLFTTESMIRDNPKIVEDIVQSTIEGWKLAFNNKSLAIDYTIKYGKELNREHELKMLNASQPLIVPDDKPIGWMDKEIWENMKNLLLENGFIKQNMDVTQVFKTDYLPK